MFVKTDLGCVISRTPTGSDNVLLPAGIASHSACPRYHALAASSFVCTSTAAMAMLWAVRVIVGRASDRTFAGDARKCLPARVVSAGVEVAVASLPYIFSPP